MNTVQQFVFHVLALKNAVYLVYVINQQLHLLKYVQSQIFMPPQHAYVTYMTVSKLSYKKRSLKTSPLLCTILLIQKNPVNDIKTPYFNIQSGSRNVIPFYHPIKIVTSQYRCCKRASECYSSWKMRQMSPICKMADNGRLTVDQKMNAVLFYAETKSVVATQRRFRAHFGTRWASCNRQFTDFHQEQFYSL